MHFAQRSKSRSEDFISERDRLMAAQKKYRHLRGKIAPFTEKPEYQSRIDEKKQELLGTLEGEDANTNRLAAMIVKREYEKKGLYSKYGSKETTDQEYEINLYRTALSQMICTAMI